MGSQWIFPHIFVWGSCFWFCIPGSASSAFSSSALLHTLSTHALSTYTLSPHTLSTHTLSTYTLSTYIFSTNTLSPHTLSTHTLSTYTLSTYIFSTNTLSKTLCPHTLCPHTLCHHTLCPHTLCHHTLCPQTLCPQTLCHHTLYQHTLCHHTLCPHTLSQHTLCQHTFSQHTLCQHTFSQQTLCPKHFVHTHFVHTHFVTTHFVHTHFVTTHFVHKHFVHKHFVHTRFINIHFQHTFSQHTLCQHTFSQQTLCHHTLCPHTLYQRILRQHTLCHHTLCHHTLWHNLTSTFVSRGRLVHTHFINEYFVNTHFVTTHFVTIHFGTTWHPPSFHVAGVAQTDICRRFAWHAWDRWYWVAPLGRDLAPVTPRHFAWQAWHNLTSTFVSRGRRGTKSHLLSFCVAGVALMVLGGALGPGFGACDAAALCVAGVAQPDIHLRFTWQAWHKLTSTVVLRGRRGAYGTGWRAWAGIWRLWRRGTLRGRRGTTWHPPSFHVAGVAQTHIYRRFAWQAWHLWYWVARLGRDLAPVTPRHFAWQAWHNLTSTFVSRGRRGTNSHPPSFCVAGVALMVLGGALGPGFGACDAAALCVAGVAQPDIHLRFTWQAWHKVTSTVVLRGRRGTYGTGWRPWAGIWRLWRRGTLRGRRGTTWHPPSFHVAGVAQTHIHRRFAWQAWHLWYWVARLGRDLAPVTPRHFAWQAWHNLTSTFVSRGRRGTNSHPPSFCVAGVALMVLGGALGPGFGACDAAALCVAGVAQPDIHLRFTWQAWHKVTSTVVLRGRRGTYGTGWRPWAGIWRLWRRGTLRGRRGTTWHPPSFHVAGVAQTHIHRRFAWQAWHLWYWVAPLGRDLAPVTPRHFAWQAWHNLTSTFVSRGRRGTKSHLPSFCVAGVALMVLGGALGPGFGACDAAALCVAGVAQPDIHLRFTWQAWHKLTSTVVLRGRRGTLMPGYNIINGHASIALRRTSWRGASLIVAAHHTHILAHTYTHTHTHTPHPQTQLIRTQLTHTYSSTPNLLHTNPSPSLFSFLLTPCRLCLSFVACWKKLTCGVIRSFNGLVIMG